MYDLVKILSFSKKLQEYTLFLESCLKMQVISCIKFKEDLSSSCENLPRILSDHDKIYCSYNLQVLYRIIEYMHA